MTEVYGILLFFFLFFAILKGYPISFTLGGFSLLFAIIISFIYPDLHFLKQFSLLPSRFMGILSNYVLMAVPMFVFMGILLEKSGLAKELLEVMAMLFGSIRGGLAISVILVGALLAASTGIVGATVVTMGLISLPAMISRNYDKSLATGVICAAGTLGQIIPPSVLLIILADTINNISKSGNSVDVGAIFSAAMVPGLILVIFYIIYVLVVSYFKRSLAPCIPKVERDDFFKEKNLPFRIFKIVFLPFLLIFCVLGSIFFGIAPPTEASAIGVVGALGLMSTQKNFSFPMIRDAAQETVKLTSMIFFILLGASTFSLVFRELGGDVFLEGLIKETNIPASTFLLLVMLVVFISGFFIDYLEIIFIFIPVVTPIFNHYGLDMLWVAILLSLNLQTSFLTPPFGFSLFYLKAVAPPEVKNNHFYRGIIPFILIQLLVMMLVFFFPSIIDFSF